MCLILMLMLCQEPETFLPILDIGGGTAAWGDVDGDGWVDLYASGTLWWNRGGERFEKGPSHGTGLLGDIDGDGDLDLFVYSGSRILRNDEGTFHPVKVPEGAPASVLGGCFADLDGDGKLDVYVAGYEDWEKQITYPDRVLLNRGEEFVLGFEDGAYRARGATAADFDRDGDLDVYVSNYRLHPNRLWLNDGRGKLTDGTADAGALATSEGFSGGHSIGACWGDFDGDGWLDLFAGNFAHQDSRGDQPKSRFLRNTGEGHFDDKGECGVWYQESYASPAAADFDGDGDLDLYFTTVYATASFGRPNHPVLYRNDGDWTFSDVTKGSGLEELPPTYQAAWADFDHDGDLDLVTAGHLWENRSASGGHWLEITLSPPARAVGAQVRVHIGGRTLTRQVEAGTGQGNQNEETLHFGLGPNEGSLKVAILWPGGQEQTLDNVTPDQRLTVEPAAKRGD
ncbi:MAG: CRTAC1 family protein [Planctomycetota bacterium]